MGQISSFLCAPNEGNNCEPCPKAKIKQAAPETKVEYDEVHFIVECIKSGGVTSMYEDELLRLIQESKTNKVDVFAACFPIIESLSEEYLLEVLKCMPKDCKCKVFKACLPILNPKLSGEACLLAVADFIPEEKLVTFLTDAMKKITVSDLHTIITKLGKSTRPQHENIRLQIAFAISYPREISDDTFAAIVNDMEDSAKIWFIESYRKAKVTHVNDACLLSILSNTPDNWKQAMIGQLHKMCDLTGLEIAMRKTYKDQRMLLTELDTYVPLYTGNPKRKVSHALKKSTAKRQCKSKKPKRMCAVCFASKAVGAFVPCGHRVCCMTCGPKLHLCPICRCVTETFIKVF